MTTLAGSLVPVGELGGERTGPRHPRVGHSAQPPQPLVVEVHAALQPTLPSGGAGEPLDGPPSAGERSSRGVPIARRPGETCHDDSDPRPWPAPGDRRTDD